MWLIIFWAVFIAVLFECALKCADKIELGLCGNIVLFLLVMCIYAFGIIGIFSII